ncbi:MAG: TonB family protein [Acidobacteriota bacterium]|nr:TonB family protein [Acidobacteriota bacterium]
MKKALTFVLAFSCLALGLNRSTFAQDNAIRTQVSGAAESGNREQDRLNGPVRRVRVETSKITPKDGDWVEGRREVLGITTYDPAGRKIDSVAYPVESSALSGKEQYLYDDKGNVVEMILRSTDGSMLSKESYKYEFDQLENWTKMSSSVAVYENGKIIFEPIGTTYRTISYYYNQTIEKFNAPSSNPKTVSAPSTSATLLPNSKAKKTDSPRPSIPTAQVSASIQPLPEAANSHPRKELVSAPASVTPAKSGTAAPEGPVATSNEIRITPDNATATSVVQRLAEEDLRNAAIEFPKPEYSDAALLARASGKVTVEILVDENGRVTNAKATSGHPLLGSAAEAAARKARFSFTRTSAGATKVYGLISYDFVPPTAASEPLPAISKTIDKNPPKPDDRKPEAKAISETAASLDSKPKDSENYSEAARSFYNKGVTFQAAGRYAEAAEAFNQTIRVDPNNARAYARLAMSYSAMHKHKDAIVVYKMARKVNRSVLDASAYYMWGHSNLALDKTSDALSVFKQALYITRAEAIDLEQKGDQRYPSLEQLHYGMGIAYLNSRRFANSIDELKRVVKLNPKNAEAHYALAVAHLSTGNRKEAEVQRKTLTSLDSALAQKISSALALAGLPPGCLNIACR